MNVVTFYFWNLKLIQSLHIFVLLFLLSMVDQTFGKNLNIRKKSQQVTYTGIAHVQKISFLPIRR